METLTKEHSRKVISIFGYQGSGKTTLAEEMEKLEPQKYSRVPTDLFLHSRVDDDFFKKPIPYDWDLLRQKLVGEDGALQTAPNYDYDNWKLISNDGGPKFRLAEFMIVDSMVPYPGCDYAIKVVAREDIRRERVLERDRRLGVKIINFWDWHNLTMESVCEDNIRIDLVINGEESVESNVLRILKFFEGK